MRMMVALVLFIACGLVSAAEKNPYAGTWKLNVQKSIGPPPAWVQNGILKLPAEIYTGASSAQPAGKTAGRSDGVYKFDLSPDGRTLTVTQPQRSSRDKAVFERQ